MYLLKVHLFVSGRVQGVGLRFFVSQKAKALHLSGWVRNRKDGRVEMVLVGSPSSVEKMIEKLEKGVVSPLARIEEVEEIARQKIKKDPFGGEFTILATQ